MPRAGTSAAPAARREKRDGDRLPAAERRSTPPVLGPLQPDAALEAYLDALERGEPWYDALLGVIARWVAADEDSVDGAPRALPTGTARSRARRRE